MKNISYIINGVLAVAIIILFILFFTSSNGRSDEPKTVKFSEGDSTNVLPIAYVTVDSLLKNYNLFKDLNDELMKDQSTIESTVAQKRQQLQNEANEFNRKLQNNAFLSQDRAEQEATRIRNLEASTQNSIAKMQNDYLEKQARMNAQIFDSIHVNLDNYNKKANYEIIFINTQLDNILVAKKPYDITSAIISQMNNRYKANASK
ncbi:MAG: OmpH family outer membrane protein [Prevotella sp.]|jgi:outer membrane protein|nr:OmpH family outer membrane protein [Prevotella sp.]